MSILPVSRRQVVLRPLAGEDDMWLAENGTGHAAGVALLARLASCEGDEAIDIAALPVTDVQVLMLDLHRRHHGPDISASLACRHCAAAIAVSFGIQAYIDHHGPRPARGAEPEEGGWWRLGGTNFRYRLPTAADLLAAENAPQPELLLRRRCFAEPDAPIALRKRAERLMARQAPNLSQVIDAACPDCGLTTAFHLDIESYVMAVLRGDAVFVYGDMHLLALHYHWPEAVVLAMPRARRVRYAEMLRGAA